MRHLTCCRTIDAPAIPPVGHYDDEGVIYLRQRVINNSHSPCSLINLSHLRESFCDLETYICVSQKHPCATERNMPMPAGVSAVRLQKGAIWGHEATETPSFTT